MKAFTLYFYSKSGSCIVYFGIDSKSKKGALKLGKAIAKLLEDHYSSMPWGSKITVKAEEYKP